jgi:nucleoside-diphosphate-sugar epimerase
MLEHANLPPRKPERVVLLGGGGFFGKALARELTRAGIPFAAPASADLDLCGEGARTALAGLLRPTDSLVILSALTPDRGRGIDTFMANLRMIENVCAVLAAAPPAHVVYFSSDAVYPFGTGILDENSPAAPADLYGAMHRSRELMLLQATPSNLCILRPSLVHGAEDTHNSYGPNRFRRQAAKEGRITLGGEGEETRDHVYIDDIAALTLRVLNHGSRGLLNLATGRSRSFGEIARMVAARSSVPVEIRFTPRTSPITHRAFDTTALLKAFPGYVFTSLEQGIALTQAEG